MPREERGGPPCWSRQAVPSFLPHADREPCPEVVRLPSAAARSASPPGGLLLTHHGMSRPRRWGVERGGALVLALTPVVDLCPAREAAST